VVNAVAELPDLILVAQSLAGFTAPLVVEHLEHYRTEVGV
jgi:hypothetical protein